MPMLAELLLVAALAALVVGYRLYVRRSATTSAVDTPLGPVEPLARSWEQAPAQHRPFKPVYHITMGACPLSGTGNR